MLLELQCNNSSFFSKKNTINSDILAVISTAVVNQWMLNDVLCLFVAFYYDEASFLMKYFIKLFKLSAVEYMAVLEKLNFCQ